MAKKRDIDPEKGFRIHFNSLQHSDVLSTFAQSHAGTSMAESTWYPNDPDLEGRESRVVRSLDDLLALMQAGEHRRIAESVVLFGSNAPMPWKEFFIREGKADGMERFTDLYNRVGKIKGGDPVPCAMLFQASETKTIGLLRDKKGESGKRTGAYRDVWIKGQGIYAEGKNVDFELYFSYMKHGNLQTFTINQGQLILATGMAERGFASHSRETVRVYIDHENAARWITRRELTERPKDEKTPSVAPNGLPYGFFTSRLD